MFTVTVAGASEEVLDRLPSLRVVLTLMALFFFFVLKNGVFFELAELLRGLRYEYIGTEPEKLSSMLAGDTNDCIRGVEVNQPTRGLLPYRYVVQSRLPSEMWLWRWTRSWYMQLLVPARHRARY